MRFSKNFFVILTTCFFLNSENHCKFLLNGEIQFGVALCSSESFKMGCSSGISIFAFQLSSRKTTASLGGFIEILELSFLEKFHLSINAICSISSFQDFKYLGVRGTLLLRPWSYPIDIGFCCFCTKVSPKLSMGFVISPNFEFYNYFNVRALASVAYILDKNVEDLLKKKEFYETFFEKAQLPGTFDQELLDIIQKNRDCLKENDAYYRKFNDLCIQKDNFDKKIQEFAKGPAEGNWSAWDEHLNSFEQLKDNLKMKLRGVLQEFSSYKSVKIEYFSSQQLSKIRAFLLNLEAEQEKRFQKIQEMSDKFEQEDGEDEDEYKLDIKYDVTSYFYSQIIEIIFNPTFMVEATINLLEAQEKIEREGGPKHQKRKWYQRKKK